MWAWRSGYYKSIIIDYLSNVSARKQGQDQRQGARAALAEAVLKKAIPPAKELGCSTCPARATEYHHHKGYDEVHWLDVIPLCNKCHHEAEKKIRLRCQGITQAGTPCGRNAMIGLTHCENHIEQGLTDLERQLISECCKLRSKMTEARFELDELAKLCNTPLLKLLTKKLEAINKLLALE